MRSEQKLRLGIFAFGVLLIAALIGSVAADGWRLRRQITVANNRELGNLAKAFAEEAARSLQAVDLLLRDTAAWYGTSGTALDAGAIESALASRAVGVAQVSVLTIVGADGKQRFRSRATGEPLADVSDRPYFTRQRDSDMAGFIISEPIVSRTDRIPAIVLSRRFTDARGRFGGVVTAIVTLQQLQSAYSAIDLGEGSALLLTLEDGTLVVRQPRVAGLEGKLKFPELVAVKDDARVDRAVSPMDGRMKLIAASNVGNVPLILAITRDEDQALRPWRDEMGSAIVRTVLLSLLVLATMIGLLRQLRRIERADGALRVSEERYAMAMDAANEGHAEWNPREDTLFTSAKWRALHGIPSAEIVATGTALRRRLVVHPDDVDRIVTSLDDHLAGRTSMIEFEYRVRMPAGEWRWVHTRGRCVVGADGRPRRLFCAALDVTDRKNAEAERAGLEARMQQTQKLEALGTLAGGIAHDFNNILGAVLGFGEMAQQLTEAGSAIRRHIDRVLQAGVRARLLVRQILDFSRSGVEEYVPVDLQRVVDEVTGLLGPSLPDGVRFVVERDAGPAAVMGDATQLVQVAMNLCTNAIQATGPGGQVEVSVGRTRLQARRSFVQGRLLPGDYVRLGVGDTGAGIPAGVQSRMFDPFFTTKRVGEGTGLGLSVVHGIVSSLGGAIDVAARPGGGTVVTVWLPLSEESGESPGSGAGDWPRGNGELVMIVDDEQALVELAEELLASLGYEPVGYDSSVKALAAFESAPDRFDLVLTDELLPVMQGSELARRLLMIRPDLPIVLMSGNLDRDGAAHAMGIGVTAILHKPLELRALARCLASIVEGRRPA